VDTRELQAISARIHQDFEARSLARDEALGRSRKLVRHCASSIRATHRLEFDTAEALLLAAEKIAAEMVSEVKAYPDLYFAGYTQDAMKEYAEAEELGVEYPAYLGGLAEAVGELRRHALDLMRHGNTAQAEELLGTMDEVYDALVTFDFPDAITRGLRRLTDMVRGVTERTRGELTVATRQDALRQALDDFEGRMDR
jgi:translin